jgi:hypothetical protein
MHFPQWPDTTTYGVDVFAMTPIILADDFRCTITAPITRIIIWGSWWNDMTYADGGPAFKLSIWSDQPATDSVKFSQPDEALWSMEFIYPNYTAALYYEVPQGEWWYNPAGPHFNPMGSSDVLVHPGDYEVWHYIFDIPRENAFVQEKGKIYWLALSQVSIENYFFGWKSSVNHWNDDAVYSTTDEIAWHEMIYPDGHPFYPLSMDLAFCIYGKPDVAIEQSGFTPTEYRLEQSFPNPFNPVTTITYLLPERALVSLEIYDLTGRLVRVLVDNIQDAGTYRVDWDASGMPSGVYFYRIQAGQFSDIKKCLLMK